MLTSSEVLMTVAKECDRFLAAPKDALWMDDELIVVWEGKKPLRMTDVNRSVLRNTVATLIHMNLSREESSPLRFRKMLVALARTFDGALKEWSELLLKEVPVASD